MSEPNEDNIINAEIVDDLPAVREETHERPRAMEEGPGTSRDWSTYARPERRCTAHSSRTGEQCKNAAIKGANVCRFHGGASKYVKAAARARLDNAADLMARNLLGIAIAGDSEAVRLAAIRDALDRAGLKPPSEVVVSQSETKPYEDIFDEISTASRAESRAARGVTEEPDRQTLGYDFDAGKDDDHYRVDTSPAMDDTTDWPHAPPPQPSQPAQRRERGDQAANRPAHPAPNRHITGDDALSVAAQLAQAQRAIESGGHKRYLRPGTDGR